MPVEKITQRLVDTATSNGKAREFYRDSALTGFVLGVTKAGGKAFYVEYRAEGAAFQTRYKFGNPARTSAEDARAEARQLLAAIDKGANPVAEKEKRKAVPTFGEFAQTFLNDEVRAHRSAGTLGVYTIHVKHAAEELGSLKLTAINKTHVKALHAKLGKDRGKVTANRVLATVSGLYKYADAVGAVADGYNPVREARVKKFKEEGKERFLSNEELQALGAAIHEAETVGIEWQVDASKPQSKHAPKAENRRTVIDPYTASALRLLIFTGCRLREILHLRWDEVDFQRGMLFLAKSKTGRKPVILNAPAMSVLSALASIKTGPYVIPSPVDSNKPRVDLKKPWALVSRCAGLDGVRIHDLRHTHASVAAGLGVSLPIIGKLLGHSQASTTEKYAHLAADPVRAASDKTAQALAEALGVPSPHAVEPGAGAGNVTPLRCKA